MSRDSITERKSGRRMHFMRTAESNFTHTEFRYIERQISLWKSFKTEDTGWRSRDGELGVVHGELPTKATAGRNPRGLAQGRTLSSLRDWASEARRSTQICLPEQGMLTFRERKNWVIEGHNVSDRKDTKNEEGNGIPETRRAEHSREARNVKWTHRRSRKAKARNYSGPRLFHADRKQGLLDADGAESTSAPRSLTPASLPRTRLSLDPFSFTFQSLHVDVLPSGETFLSSLLLNR